MKGLSLLVGHFLSKPRLTLEGMIRKRCPSLFYLRLGRKRDWPEHVTAEKKLDRPYNKASLQHHRPRKRTKGDEDSGCSALDCEMDYQGWFWCCTLVHLLCYLFRSWVLLMRVLQISSSWPMEHTPAHFCPEFWSFEMLIA